MSGEGLGNQQELKGMGENNKWCEGRMEIRVNGTLTMELCMSPLLRNNKFQEFWRTKVAVAEKHSVLVSRRRTKLGSLERTGGTSGRPHERGLSWWCPRNGPVLNDLCKVMFRAERALLISLPFCV